MKSLRVEAFDRTRAEDWEQIDLGTACYLTSETLNQLILLKCLPEQLALSKYYVNYINHKTTEVVTVIVIPMLQMRFSEVKPLAQGHTAGKSEGLV